MPKVFTIAGKKDQEVEFALTMYGGDVTLTANGVNLLSIAKDSAVVLFGTTKESRKKAGLEFTNSGSLNVYGHRRE